MPKQNYYSKANHTIVNFLVRFQTPIFFLFMGVGLFFLLNIKTLFNSGFFETIKWLAIPLAILIFGFTYINFKTLSSWEGCKRTNPLLRALLYYPIILLFSWPYLLAANSIRGNEHRIVIAGPIVEKIVNKGGRWGPTYLLKIKDEHSGQILTQVVHEKKFNSLTEGLQYQYCYYKGTFDIPYHWRGSPPEDCINDAYSVTKIHPFT